MTDLEQFLQSIARGFDTSPRTVLLFLIIAGGAVLFFIASFLIITAARKVKAKQTSRLMYQNLIRKFDLTINEIDLVSRFSIFLKHPEKKHLLLTNVNTFVSAVDRLIADKEIDKERLDTLMVKLGFGSSIERVKENIPSTREFSSSEVVLLSRTGENKQQYIPAKVVEINNAGFSVSFLSSVSPAPDESKIRVFALESRRIRRFTCTVIKRSSKGLILGHADSDSLDKKRLSLQLYYRKENGEPDNFHPAVLETVKGGIGFLSGLTERIRNGRDIRIYLYAHPQNKHYLNANVRKASKRSGRAIVQFAHVKE